MAILFQNPSNAPTWVAELAALLPNDEIRTWPDVGDPADIEFVAMWNIPVAELAQFPNARALLLIGAGVNHLGPLDQLPDLPIVRLVDQAVANDMAAYALHWVLHNHRQFDRYATQQSERIWREHSYVAASDYTVGVLGMGSIGRVVAHTALGSGYQVRGWSRTPRSIQDITSFSAGQLDEFMTGVDALVNVLPLTPETIGIVDAAALARLNPGAIVINIGRGETTDDQALLAALDSGHIATAALDVFATEPLPEDSRFWNHPRVRMTPHISGSTYARSAASYLAANIERIRAGVEPFPVVDRARGY